MDPLGFALENFDAIGAWRVKDREAGAAIDSSGQLADGTVVNGPVDLRDALLAEPTQFVQTLTEKLMIYALGRSVEYYDMPAVRRIVRDAEPRGLPVLGDLGRDRAERAVQIQHGAGGRR